MKSDLLKDNAGAATEANIAVNSQKQMGIEDLTIVVCCHKKDYFLAKICLASIRYYYPSIAVELVKDEGNGKFNSTELEKYLDVKVVDLDVKKMGWSGAKFHYLYRMPRGKKVLMLDADIVFAGPFLERLLPSISSNDYLVSIDESDLLDKEWIHKTYFDIDAIRAAYPAYQFPGYFFNAGQIFLTVGAISTHVLDQFFNVNSYPYWLKKELFPLVDQSAYNYLLPTLEAENKIRLGKEKFMIWAKSKEAGEIELREIINQRVTSGLIHWAGCVRHTAVSKMAAGAILCFFEKYYYSLIKRGQMKRFLRRTISLLDYHVRQLYYKLKVSG
jgi:hypothetical protein